MNNTEKLYNYVLTQVEDKLTNKTTNNEQIDKFCNKYLKDDYIGCYPADYKINDNILKYKKYVIYNLSKSNEAGTHWVSVIFDYNNKTIIFYDSYGRNNKNIFYHLQKMYKKYKILNSEKDAEQTLLETNCGARSCSFLICHKIVGNEVLKI